MPTTVDAATDSFKAAISLVDKEFWRNDGFR
jgi:hypothetical protein